MREEAREGVGRDASEEGWADEDTADDLSDDAGLRELAGEPAADEARQQDDRDLEDEEGHGVYVTTSAWPLRLLRFA